MVLTYLSRDMANHFIVVRKAYIELVATEGFQHGATLDNYTFYLAILLLVLFHNKYAKNLISMPYMQLIQDLEIPYHKD